MSRMSGCPVNRWWGKEEGGVERARGNNKAQQEQGRMGMIIQVKPHCLLCYKVSVGQVCPIALLYIQDLFWIYNGGSSHLEVWNKCCRNTEMSNTLHSTRNSHTLSKHCTLTDNSEFGNIFVNIVLDWNVLDALYPLCRCNIQISPLKTKYLVWILSAPLQ